MIASIEKLHNNPAYMKDNFPEPVHGASSNNTSKVSLSLT